MPPIMAGIVAIYGLVISVLMLDTLEEKSALHTNFLMLGAGLAVGISGLASGFSIGIIGDAGVRGTAQQPKLFVGMVLILIFAEVLGEYPPTRSWRERGERKDLGRGFGHADRDTRSLWSYCGDFDVDEVEAGGDEMYVNWGTRHLAWGCGNI
jgi:F0F1-type ATP synthase membrane subunit c/vacuolar-type H+-ATPase subunit K